MASSIQLLRSTNPQERPFAGNLLEGQPAANIHSSEPGLFFKTTDGSIVKFGPAAITSDGSPPNSVPQGSAGNSVGELWLDKSLNPAVLKVYDGAQWVDAGSGSGGGSGSFLRWIYTAVGGETSLSGSSGGVLLDYTPGLEEVYVNGVLITRGTNYSATNGSSITNLAPLTAGDVVTVLSMNPLSTVQLPGQVTLLRWTILAAAGQTVLSGVDSSSQQLAYTAGFEEVYVNGAFLRRGLDYTATNGTSVTLSSPLTLDDEVTVLAWTPFTVGSQIINSDVAPGAAIDSEKLSYIPPLTGAVERTVESRLRDFVSVKDFGAKGDGQTDDTAAIQRALDASKTVYFPPGTYIVSDTVRKDVPRPTRNRLFGSGKYTTILKAAPGMLNKPILHFGDTSGHGAPQVELVDMGFNGHDKTNGVSGVFLQEGGICHLANISATRCYVGIDGTGATDTLIDGDNFISSCEIGVRMLWQSPGIGPSNEVRIRNVWITACNQAVYAEGDFVEISGCTSQSCGLDGTKHVFEVNNSAHIGFTEFGANIYNNWVEGGFSKYAIAVIGAGAPIVYNNLLIGQGSIPQADREGAILIDQCPNADVNSNRIYQFFTRPPQDGRLENAAVYIKASANTGQNWRTWHNIIRRSQAGNEYYFEGLPEPRNSKDGYQNIWAYISISGTTASVDNGKNVSNVVRYGGAGQWQVNFPYNRESLNTPVFIQSIGSTPLFCSYQNNGLASVRVQFYDSAGVLTDPSGFSVMCLAEQNIN